MRAPFQILALPYKFEEGQLLFCVMHRSSCDMWQFISGGGEDLETPLQAARREIFEESGACIDEQQIIQLRSMCHIATDIYPEKYLRSWPKGTYTVPEYSFGFEFNGDIQLSDEHTEFRYLPYEQARAILKWDSNRTALYELYRRLAD